MSSKKKSNSVTDAINRLKNGLGGKQSKTHMQASQSKPAKPDYPAVMVAVGAGNDPIPVKWEEGDTVASILQRAQITVGPGQTPTLGKKRIVNPEETTVQPDDVIVIAGMPANG